ncbi:alpha-(1-_6)-mannopyranosyltransferase A [Mycolicibacter virginiensis]|uniref:alpha-(1->6)-mannopyranosyltransferase A n=1 Tax=Mycolicibacter virginiensis TaxID=1795032 RepID=UPI001F03ED76|nr:alpha-(1->6)-mannopyranosyltransferase A [Mycolicibacter virginiensis]ULP49290.1 alpha-(1->6)-mannopyranosyltransferase A [Mycolicibacter virginiensis]
MSNPTTPPVPRASSDAVSGLSRLRQFAAGEQAGAAWLGCLGALLITLGGLGAGSTRIQDPVLDSLHLSWLRFGHGLVLSSVLLWAGVAVMLVAWLGLGRRVIEGTVSTYTLITTTGFWLAPLLLSVPVFSRDTYSYLAQGALLRDGFDPYVVGPVDNPNPLLEDVSPIWAATTAPYGPAFILVAKLVTMLVGNNVVAGTMVLRLCMLPGLALLIWAAPRVAARVGGSAPAALYLAVLNPLVIIHLMGGVHNEMLMVGLVIAGIALTLERRHLAGITLVALAAAVKATAAIALPFLVWIWMRRLREPRGERRGLARLDEGEPKLEPRNERRGYPTVIAFAIAAAVSTAIIVAVFAVLSALAGVSLGWLTALLAGNVKIINWLTVPTAAANLIHAVGGLFAPVNFYAVLHITRISGVAVIGLLLPVLWWRARRDDRAAVAGIAWAMLVVVLFVPAALPWYYTWPLAVAATVVRSPTAIAAIAAASTWIMVIFKPDGSHGMYTWLHVIGATGCAVYAWYRLSRAQQAPALDAA